MRTQTVLIIVATGILLGLTGFWLLMRSINQDIIEASQLIDSMQIESDREWKKIRESTPKFDSTGFIFITDTPDARSYILKGDSTSPNIFLNSDGK